MNNSIRERRKDLGWTQTALGERLGVSRQTVIALEAGRYDPSLPLAFKLARVFGCYIEDVFDDGQGPVLQKAAE
ncbi:MAG: helix-turn-helix transcriptional regulator [Maricaulaceae bacterium]